MNSLVRFVKRYPWSLVVVAAILFLSFFKPPQQDFVPVTNIDKLAHFCMYAGFCSVVWLEYFFSHKAVSRRRVIVGAVVGPILFSGLIEVAQGYLTSYRGMDFYDLIFNTIGVQSIFCDHGCWHIKRKRAAKSNFAALFCVIANIVVSRCK